MRYVFFLITASAFALPAANASAATLELEPSSDWSVRQYDDKCRMTRTFGEGENKSTLWIEKVTLDRLVNITVIGRPFRNPYGERIGLAFSPGETLKRGFVRNTSSKGRPVVTMFGVAPISFERGPVKVEVSEDEEETVDLTLSGNSEIAPPDVLERRYDQVGAIQFSGALTQKVSLETGGLRLMIAQLDQCNEERFERLFKAGSGENDKGQIAVDRDTANWAPQIQANYPSYLLQEMGQGSVGIRVAINPEGRAKSCQVTEYEGPAGFTDAACLGMIRYGRFQPAKDAKGNPVWGLYNTRITYRIN